MNKSLKAAILFLCIFLISVNAYSVLGVSNEEYLTNLYKNVLDRDPDPLGFQHNLNLLNTGQVSKDGMANAFVNSKEYKEKNSQGTTSTTSQQSNNNDNGNSLINFLTGLYNTILGRDPDPGGFQHNLNLLNTGQVSKEGMENAFYASDEYQNKLQQNNENFLTNLYTGILDRKSDPQGFEHNLNLLNTDQIDFEGMAGAFLNSPEYKIKSNEEFVESLYNNILGRSSDPQGKQAHLNALNSGVSREQIIKNFYNSEEYKNKNRNNAEFVEDLYQGILGREPDQLGFGHNLNLLNTQLTRDELIDGFLNSPEYKSKSNEEFLRDLYQGILGREPDPLGFQHNLDLLNSGQVSREGMINAFINSPEFQEGIEVPEEELPPTPSYPTPSGGGGGGVPPTPPTPDLGVSVNIIADKTAGEIPLAVKFDAQVTGGDYPLTYAWDFNSDGIIDSAIKSPEALFTEEGTYLVSLTVTDVDGDTATDTVTIIAEKLGEIKSPRKKIHIDKISFENDQIKAGEDLIVYVNFENQGNYDIKNDASVTVIVPDLALREKENINLKTNKGITKKLILETPEDAEPGVYDVMIVLYDNGLQRVRYRPIEII